MAAPLQTWALTLPPSRRSIEPDCPSWHWLLSTLSGGERLNMSGKKDQALCESREQAGPTCQSSYGGAEDDTLGA